VKIVISGAGIAGLTLAVWLRRGGHRPILVERAPALVVGGYKIDVRGTALDVLHRTGIAEEVEAASTRMRGALLVDRDGAEIARMSGDDFGHRTGGDLEIVRGALCRILYDRVDDVETVFGATITAVEQSDAGVGVTLSNGDRIDADLLVGADGLHSATRALVFGPERDVRRDLGMSLCVFSVPNYLGLDREEVQYSEIGRVAAMWATRDEPLAKATFGFATRTEVDRRDRAAQERAVRDAFAGVGWEVPRLLELMSEASDWYFDTAAQIELPRWTRGRTALVGDAAYCASPMSGQGASLALLGAYVLAGELAVADGDLERAFDGYDAVMRPFVDANQALGRVSAARMTELERAGGTELSAAEIESVIDSTTGGIADAARAISLPDYPG
jgi:2-polyprenyl-6-methoxyphenol hydroxylase-like FAD-dependent oxidoreductase